jgi:DNA adenine methylase
MCKPPIKWVGGKRQLLTQLLPLLPKSYNNYYEPFFGGGALFFSLKPLNANIYDSNPELINLYKVIKNKPSELIELLHQHVNEHDYFYKIRALDRDEVVFKSLSDVERASRFVYLNKTAYNGLWRVNSKGQNNVPYGRYVNPMIVDAENILNCSIALKTAKIQCSDFTGITNSISKDDFVYFDPPYYPINITSNFTSYTKSGFDEEMQYKLKELCDYLNKIGAKFMLSNSHTPLIQNLYKDYIQTEVQASRAINCKASGRGKIKEIVVRNY